jgi:DNA (cytosine-5)-methyltransferase 1
MFSYKWTLKDAVFTKDKGKVFSCFACGGGSTMGYKLAGFDVIGCNEIDPKMMEAYKVNHNPKYAYLEPIQTFKNRDDLPEELYNLDILDGSPPCSSFSMAGNREKDWGKDKVFREGQAMQVLDTLFFDFIDLVKKLQPKVVIAENVKGLLLGDAKKYVRQIYMEFDLAGYYVQYWLLDASKMGVPQKRERVFFIAMRKDLAEPFLYNADMFTLTPKLELEFNEPEIPFNQISTNEKGYKAPKSVKELLEKCNIGDCCSLHHPKKYFSNYFLMDINKPIGTLTAGMKKSSCGYFTKKNNDYFGINKKEAMLCQTFPEDYDFLDIDLYYLIGMSVPPVMTAQIAKQVYEQWLKNIK